MGTLREETINSVKRQIATYNITQEDLGYMPRVETRVEKVSDEEFINAVKKFIADEELAEDAREYIPEKYWDDLNIRPAHKFDVYAVTLTKTVTKEVKVVVPACANDGNEFAVAILEDNNYSNIDLDDVEEEDWEVDTVQTCDADQDLTADEVRTEYDGWEIYNYDDFEDEVNNI